MRRVTESASGTWAAVEPKPAPLADFSDAESERVLTAAARAVARELGREAAREFFAELIGRTRVSE
jgi:hypothetical protein